MITLNDAYEIIFYINKYLPGICLEIVGSIFRNKSESKDLDFMCAVSLNKINFIDNPVFKITSHTNGTKYRSFNIKYFGPNNLNNTFKKFKIDIFYVTAQNYLYMRFFLTASKEYNIIIRKHAKSRGYKLTRYGLFNIKTNKQIRGINTEYDIYRKIDKEYTPVHERN